MSGTPPALTPLSGRFRPTPRVTAQAVVLLLVAMTGCGREFFREWADQDVSEAVFEKSRDPRNRLDMFSTEPPSLSRHVDPYDKDRPPAPPDDYAAQALSPVPQWPEHRLVTPVEGTGYLDMLEFWKSQTPETPRQPANAPVPPPASAPSPFTPDGNSGTGPQTLSPPSNSAVVPVVAKVFGVGEARDTRLTRAAHQETKIPPPAPGTRVKTAAKPSNIDRQVVRTQGPVTPSIPPPNPPQVPPASPDGTNLQINPPDGLRSPRVPLDPNPINEDLSRPPVGRTRSPEFDLGQPMGDLRNQSDLARLAEEANELIAMLIPDDLVYNEAEAAGLPPNSRPYRITLEQSFALGLINSRAYQFQLETIYINALAVTLQRFAFQPQFVAGISPRTTPANNIGLPVNPANSFLYRTRETGNQVSQLTLGQVAGVGKVLGTGGQILGAFAAQTVFNLNSSTPSQPTVQGFLPLTFVQPFLRGGGRAVTLELLTQAERTLLYTVRTFARFRQEFIANILVGTPVTAPGVVDPSIGYLTVAQNLQDVEIDIRNLRTFEIYLRVYSELSKGDSSGLTQLQVDQFDNSVQSARITLASDLLIYRNTLDQYKQQLGLPPDVPIVLARGPFDAFSKVYDEIERWSKRIDRKLEELPEIIEKGLPELEDLVIDGRSVLGIVSAGEEDSSKLEELLLAAERLAMENRLDLMNARAQLYDSWRQIRVTANALKGFFNVTVTNQMVTPPTTSNPFGFVDQAKQFNAVINAELPLVRVAERNAFKTALINYQRQRRALQNTEDNIKYQVRQEVRSMQTQYRNYKTQQRNLVLNIRQRDQSLLQVSAPPGAGGGAGGQGQANQAAIQVQNVRGSQGGVVATEVNLTNLWLQFQIQRITLYRDLGILPYDEWEAFYELFPAKSAGTGGASSPDTGVRPAGPVEPIVTPPGIAR